MTEREKIIDDLEKQIAWIRDNDFYKFPGWGHAVLVMRNALTLLKAQEPRVMTKGEYKALAEKPKEERDPVWEEWPGLESTWAIPEQVYDGYGTSWWAWTSRPTEEQMKAAK